MNPSQYTHVHTCCLTLLNKKCEQLVLNERKKGSVAYHLPSRLLIGWKWRHTERGPGNPGHQGAPSTGLSQTSTDQQKWSPLTVSIGSKKNLQHKVWTYLNETHVKDLKPWQSYSLQRQITSNWLPIKCMPYLGWWVKHYSHKHPSEVSFCWISAHLWHRLHWPQSTHSNWGLQDTGSLRQDPKW